MSEYWKSTPSYWCKFCSQYVRDTTIERKNHEATAKHQNSIQRSLRELHKNQEREKREEQQAKAEVARLNGMFGSKSDTSKPPTRAPAPTPSSNGPQLGTAAQRKAHAEQLAALGVELPDELKKEVTGVENYKTVTECEVQPVQDGTVTVNRSLADILAEARRKEENLKQETQDEDELHSLAMGVSKRKAEDDEDIRDEEAAPKRKAWGSNFKRYPGANNDQDDGADLDALLSGVSNKKKVPAIKTEISGEGEAAKQEEVDEPSKSMAAIPEVGELAGAAKQENSDGAPAVVFKKRKGKK
ncbi:related to formin binding [Lecanosticta acicola]|uniref:Related to formin binding n=1 Tax=Lecanosticta acicola TaxID=111012 RepID=A0AAI8Z4G9_9PEZI|nr:related to formin binding [Lecanosticta acicola]